MTGIICAMKIEAELIASKIENKSAKTISGIEFISGEIYSKKIVCAVCGIGKVFAAVCAQTMILEFGADEIINVGVAGSLTPDLHVFDIMLADSLCQHDMDTSAIGDEVGLISGINVIHIPASTRINVALEKSIRKLNLSYKRGVIASGDQFVDDRARKDFIRDTFGALACEMEGAAVAQVCYINKVDFAVLRAISDEEGGDYAKFAAKAAQNSAFVILDFLKLDK